MKSCSLLPILSVWLLASTAPAFGADRLVASGGAGTAPCNPTPCATLAEALSGFAPGDVVKMGAGTFVGNDVVVLNSGVSSITISGGWNAGFSAQDPLLTTSLSGGKTGPVLEITASNGAALTINLDHLTISKTKLKSDFSAGAVQAQTLSALTELHLNIDNVRFEKNKTFFSGGALWIQALGGSVTLDVETSTFSNNRGLGGSGGAIYLQASGPGLGSPGGTIGAAIRNSTFEKNKALYGAAIGVFEGDVDSVETNSLTIESCDFVGNKARNDGGALLAEVFDTSTLDLDLDDVGIRGNKAGRDGGGIHLDNYTGGSINAAITNTAFAANRAKANGGGLAIDATTAPSNLTLDLRNSSLSANQAVVGGGVWIDAALSTSIVNTIAWGNTASGGGADLYSSPGVSNSLMNSNVGESAGPFTDGGGNVDSDPLFVDAASDLHLQSTSPMRSAGTCTPVPMGEVDIDGDARPTGPGCEIGADELNP